MDGSKSYNQKHKIHINTNNNINKNANKSKIPNKNERRNHEKRRSIHRKKSDSPDELLYEHEEIPSSLKPDELQKSFNVSSKNNDEILKPHSKKSSFDTININVNIIINKNNENKNEEEKRINNDVKLNDNNKKNSEGINFYKQKLSNNNSDKEDIISTNNSKKYNISINKNKNLSFAKKSVSSQNTSNSNLNSLINTDKKSMKMSTRRFKFCTININGRNMENSGLRSTLSYTKYLKTCFTLPHSKENSSKKCKNNPLRLLNKEKGDIFSFLFNNEEKFYFTDYQKSNLRNIIMELNKEKNNNKNIKHEFISNKCNQENNIPKSNTNTSSNSFFFTSLDCKIKKNDSKRNDIHTNINNSYKKAQNLKTSPKITQSINYHNNNDNNKIIKKNKTTCTDYFYPKSLINNKNYKTYSKSFIQNEDALTYNNHNYYTKNRKYLIKKNKENEDFQKTYYTSPIFNNTKYNDNNLTIKKMQEYLNENKYYQKPKNNTNFLLPFRIKPDSKSNEVKKHVILSLKDPRNPYSATFTEKILMNSYNAKFHYKNFEQGVPSLYIRSYGRNNNFSSDKKIFNNDFNEKKSMLQLNFRENICYNKAKDIRMRQLQYSKKLDISKGKLK